MITEGEPFGPEWRRTPRAETHKKEYAMACILNRQMVAHDLRVRRVAGDPFSLYDLEVCEYNFADLQWGPLVCRIDLEAKPDLFPKGKDPHEKIPARWVRGVSFLRRKTDKTINYDRDVYLLFDARMSSSHYPRVIWASYWMIREYGQIEDRGPKNQFIVIRPEHYDKLHFTIHDLVRWCRRLKNQEVKEIQRE
jgi:hypothetical protein